MIPATLKILFSVYIKLNVSTSVSGGVIREGCVCSDFQNGFHGPRNCRNPYSFGYRRLVYIIPWMRPRNNYFRTPTPSSRILQCNFQKNNVPNGLLCQGEPIFLVEWIFFCNSTCEVIRHVGKLFVICPKADIIRGGKANQGAANAMLSRAPFSDKQGSGAGIEIGTSLTWHRLRSKFAFSFGSGFGY